jgi:sulfotransferase
MDSPIHFISGLPRSGSSPARRPAAPENPALHAGMTSPVGSLFTALLREMSQGNESAVFLNDDQRARLLRGLFDGHHADALPTRTVFDNRPPLDQQAPHPHSPLPRGQGDLLRPPRPLGCSTASSA